MIESPLAVGPSSNDEDIFREPEEEMRNDDSSIVTVEEKDDDLSIETVEKTENLPSTEPARTLEISPVVQSSSTECIPYTCVIRDHTLLAEAGSNPTEEVRSTARELLNREPNVGWDAFSTWRSNIRGLRFHVYQDTDEDGPRIWIFVCIYDSTRISKRQAQFFLGKIVGITELLRQNDDSWTRGEDLACQEMFSPILLQRMQEMSYMGKAAIVDDGMELSKRIIQANRKVLNDISKRKAQEEARKQAEEEALLRQLEVLNQQVLTAMEKNEDCAKDAQDEAASETHRLSPKRNVRKLFTNQSTSPLHALDRSASDGEKQIPKGLSKTPDRTTKSKDRIRTMSLDQAIPREWARRDDEVEDILQQLERRASGRRKSWAESFENGLNSTPSTASFEKDEQQSKSCIRRFIDRVMRVLARNTIHLVAVAVIYIAMRNSSWSLATQLDYICSPVKPGTSLDQARVYEAPWLAPDAVKQHLFCLCGERQRIQLAWIQLKKDSFRLTLRTADNKGIGNKLLLDERNLKSASIHSHQIILYGKSGKNRTVEAPWRLP